MSHTLFKHTSDTTAVAFVAGVLLGSVSLLGITRATDLDPENLNVRQLLSALKDPEITNRIIEKLKEPEMATLLSDPDVLKDFDKLEGQVNELVAAKIKELEDKKVFLQDVAPKQDWAKKAIDKASKQKPAERD